ncbi:MAG: hypothetical protein WCK01_01615 [Candidatus Uhrbacteria bacterium]
MFNWIIPLLRPGFWFDMNAQPFMPWLDKALPIFLAFVLVVGIGCFVFARFVKGFDKDNVRLIKRLGSLSIWASLSGLLMYAFVWERVPVLSMRVLWVVWVIGFGWWKLVILNEHFRKLPAEKLRTKEREAYEKWLPKPKK